MADKKQKDIKCVELKIWRKTENQERGGKVELRTVDWVIDGRHYIKTELREFFTSDQGDWKTGKAKGMDIGDLTILQRNWNELMRLHGSKLPEHQKSANGAPAQAAPAAAPANQQKEEDF